MSLPPIGVHTQYFPTPDQPTFPRFRSLTGFSLVEVTIALGIVTFSLLALLGSLPTGLQTTRDAQDQCARARILRHISGIATQTPFGQIDSLPSSGPYCFDNDGSPQPEADSDTRYQVILKRGGLNYPGASQISELAQYGTSLLVEIQRFPEGSSSSTGFVSIPNIGN